MKQHSQACLCATVPVLAADRHCPIAFDEDLNEYNLVSDDGKTHYRMYYCCFCGGVLPDSKRELLFTEPSSEDMADVARTLRNVLTIQQAVEVLGKPDKSVKAPAESPPNGTAQPRYKRHHLYTRRWPTLDLTVRERADGAIDTAFTGKFRANHNGAAATTRGAQRRRKSVS